MTHSAWRTWLQAGVLGVGLTGAGAAHAGADDDADDRKAEALETATRAFEAQEAGDLDAADRLYREAYCLDDDPQTVFNLATVARSQQRDGDAAALFQRYLDEAPDGELAPDAKAILKTMTKVPRGDDQIVCPKRVAPPPTDLPPVEPTRHGHDPVDDAPPTTRASSGGALRWVGVATTVVGVGLLAGGGYFALEAKGHSDAISSNTGPWTDALLARQQQGEDAAATARVLGIAGGALAITGIVLAVVGGPSDDAPPRRDRLTLAPMASATGGGLVLSGGF